MNKVYSIDNLLVNKCEFLDKTLKYSKLELRNKHSGLVSFKKRAVQCSANTCVVNKILVV